MNATLSFPDLLQSNDPFELTVSSGSLTPCMSQQASKAGEGAFD